MYNLGQLEIELQTIKLLVVVNKKLGGVLVEAIAILCTLLMAGGQIMLKVGLKAVNAGEAGSYSVCFYRHRVR